jgi:hypothetical protein
LPNSLELLAVLVAKYFVVVGTVLMVLLMMVGWSLPAPPPPFPDRPEIVDKVTIRIKSDRKWPEKVILNTNQPMISLVSADVAPVQQTTELLPDEAKDQTSIHALATSNPKAPRVDAHHKRAPAISIITRAFVSTHAASVRHRKELSRLGMGEECCHFEWAGRPELSKAVSHKLMARRDTRIGWHF